MDIKPFLGSPELLEILQMQNSIRLARDLVTALREHYDVDNGIGNIPPHIMGIADALHEALPL